MIFPEQRPTQVILGGGGRENAMATTCISMMVGWEKGGRSNCGPMGFVVGYAHGCVCLFNVSAL